METMQKLVERVEQLELTSQINLGFQPNQCPTRRSQANRIGSVVRYHCGQPGYFARGCAQPRQTAPPGTAKTNWGEPE